MSFVPGRSRIGVCRIKIKGLDFDVWRTKKFCIPCQKERSGLMYQPSYSGHTQGKYLCFHCDRKKCGSLIEAMGGKKINLAEIEKPESNERKVLLLQTRRPKK